MGCNLSKVEQGGGSVLRIIEEAKTNRRRSGRKDSIASTTELLTPEDMELTKDGKDPLTLETPHEAEELKPKVVIGEVNAAGAPLPEIIGHVDQKEKEGREDRSNKSEEKGRRLVQQHHEDDDEEDDLSGSPSFRIYFVDDNIKPVEFDKLQDGLDGVLPSKRLKCGEDAITKSKENEEGKNDEKRSSNRRKFKALRRRSMSHGFFGVPSCYNYQKEPLNSLEMATITH